MDFYRPHCKPTCPQEVATLVYTCIRSNPNTRPSAEDVCGHLRAVLTVLAPPAPVAPVGHDMHAPPALLGHGGPPGESDIHASPASASQHHGRGHGSGRPPVPTAGEGPANPSTGLRLGSGRVHAAVPPPGIHGAYLAGRHSARHTHEAIAAVAQHARQSLQQRGTRAGRIAAHDTEQEKQWKKRDDEDEQARAADRVGENWFNPQAVQKDEDEKAEEPHPVPEVAASATGGKAAEAARPGFLQKLLGCCARGTS